MVLQPASTKLRCQGTQEFLCLVTGLTGLQPTTAKLRCQGTQGFLCPVTALMGLQPTTTKLPFPGTREYLRLTTAPIGLQILAYCLYDDVTDVDGNVRRVRVRSSYADIAEDCWKGFGRKMIIIIQLIYVTAVATLYLELSGFILVETFPQAGISELGWTLLSTILVLPTIFLRTLTRISWSSMLAVMAVSTMFGSVLAYSIYEMKKEGWEFTLDHRVTIESFTTCCGVLLFNFEASFAIAGVEESMRDRSKFARMVNLSYVFCTFFLLLYSIPPYIAFGDNTKEFITYNLPNNAIHTI
uniref:Vesicular inhibitory amino acid transporter-like n=1 Tax=Saccoglossus kowalevskii TaxID=10224 RepID=A0ABM0GYK6_SACKO